MVATIPTVCTNHCGQSEAGCHRLDHDRYPQASYAQSLRQLPDGTRVAVRWRYLLPDE